MPCAGPKGRDDRPRTWPERGWSHSTLALFGNAKRFGRYPKGTVLWESASPVSTLNQERPQPSELNDQPRQQSRYRGAECRR